MLLAEFELKQFYNNVLTGTKKQKNYTYHLNIEHKYHRPTHQIWLVSINCTDTKVWTDVTDGRHYDYNTPLAIIWPRGKNKLLMVHNVIIFIYCTRHKAQVFMDMLTGFNWTYVSLIYSEGSYGSNMGAQFTKATKATG